jgi:hypothetical protein
MQHLVDQIRGIWAQIPFRRSCAIVKVELLLITIRRRPLAPSSMVAHSLPATGYVIELPHQSDGNI